MAYLGRQGVTAPLTSADIPDNSITSAKIVDDSVTTVKILDDNVTAAKIPAGAVSSDVLYLENATAAQELSGTFATGTERLYFNDLYTLTGNLTIQENAHLALGTIADKDVLIEADTGSTERTITGEGTLEAGNVLQDTHRTSLTDMTGELGSVVTGSPAITGFGTVTTGTLGSGVTFPAGHVIQVVSTIETTVHTVYSSSKVDVGLDVSITPSSSSNDILVFVDLEIAPMYVAGVDGRGSAHLLRDSTVILDQPTLGFYLAGVGTDSNIYTRIGFHRLDSPNTTSGVTYKIQVGKGNANHFSMNNGTGSSITLMEVKR